MIKKMANSIEKSSEEQLNSLIKLAGEEAKSQRQKLLKKHFQKIKKSIEEVIAFKAQKC